MSPMKKMKLFLKKLSKEIRELKTARKIDKRGGRSLWSIFCAIDDRKYEFRHRHIAYCEIRGRTRDQIEKPAEDNLPNERKIEAEKERLLKELEEYYASKEAA